ncbi:hypothetical protein MPLA_1800115 [Mesorhizobium sp. ORS 3359]|nr:hypothetical protein MPLA_1800115 [Mesorhizobium sp. ORS 3359]
MLRQTYNGLKPIATVLFSIPVVGYLLRIVVGLAKLPRFNLYLRRFEGRLNEMNDRLNGLAAGERVNRVNAVVEQFPRVVEAVTATQTALRAYHRMPSNTVARSSDASFFVDPQIEVVPEVQLRRTSPRSINRLPRLSDWAIDSPLARRFAELKEPYTVHRKMWEYAICLEGLEAMGVISPSATGVAVGAGSERPLFYYANQIDLMVATDLYDNPQHEGTPAMLLDPTSFAPFPYRQEGLKVFRMPGEALDFPDEHFDFAFCLSSIEHFGSRENQARALNEMARVVRPGGAVCIITELVINGEKHHEYFTPPELQQMFLEHPRLRLEGGSPEMRISDLLLACPIDVREPDDLKSAPHLVLTDGRVVWTSMSMFFRRV